MLVKPKTITQAQITGEHGVALVKDRVHALGFLFTPYGPVEAGIDALIEIRDSTTGQVGGRFIAVQIKTRDDRPYDAETDTGFEYLCKPEDVKYWQQASVPVIVVLVRLSDRSVYWKPVPRQGPAYDPDTRRLRINKTADTLDHQAREVIMQLAVDQATPGVWLPPSRQAEPILFNAVRVVLPNDMQVAATPYRHGRDIRKALLDITDAPPVEWAARGDRLIAFLDIAMSPLRHVADLGSIETFAVEEFALHDDEDEQWLFVELLNHTLRSQLSSILAWSWMVNSFYFHADEIKIDRSWRYQSVKKQTERAVVAAKRRPDQSIAYVRHSAFIPRFWRNLDHWYLAVEPTYIFTRDGVHPDWFAGERISRLKRKERNASIRGQFVMWQALLTGLGQPDAQRDLLAPPPELPILRFESLDAIEVPVSLRDDLWRSRDDYAPQDDEEDLAL